MEKPLFDYQDDVANYVRQASFVYEVLADIVKAHCGGFRGKTVLDVGAGFSLPHGGLTLSLAKRDGALQVFGIDITSPDYHAGDADKVAFWRQASGQLGVPCGGLEQNRVYLGDFDSLHADAMAPGVVCLQMSASNMYFRDNMFDLMFSNAVFEHVKRPEAVLREMFRVMAPGGKAVINWNPYSGLVMGGHDVGMPFHYPWAHLRVSEARHAELLKEVFSDPKLYKTAFPAEHTPTDGRVPAILADTTLFRRQITDDLNKMRVPEMLAYAEAAGFTVLQSVFHIRDEHRPYLTDAIRKELPGYSDDEMLLLLHTAILEKKADAGVQKAMLWKDETTLWQKAKRRVKRALRPLRRRSRG